VKSLNLIDDDDFIAVSTMGVYDRFAEHYDLIYKEIVDYEKETDDFEKLFAKFCRKKPRSILDIGCGTGSHSLLLSKRGYSVTGIDIAKRMIALAKRKASEEKSDVEFLVQDMRNIDLHRRFDCAICAFGGFGYVLTYADLTRVFEGLGKHLNSEGIFVFEFWNVGGIKPSPYQTWMKIEGKSFVLYRLSESNFDAQTNILTVDFNFIELHDGKPAETFSETHKIRCYTAPEIKKYLEDNGFALVSVFDWGTKGLMDFKLPGKETFRILAVAKRV
jgi:SAM-dependent methyltransferase